MITRAHFTPRRLSSLAGLLGAIALWAAPGCGGGSENGPDGNGGDGDGAGTGGDQGEGSGGSGGQVVPPGTWQNVHIGGGGYVTGVVYHPTDAGAFYARTDMGGLYRYDAASARWVQLLDFIGRDQAHHYGILSVALDPTNSANVYAMAGTYTDPSWAGKGALLRSSDHGENWERIDLSGAVVGGLEGVWVGGNEEGRGTGERLVVDPDQPTTLYMGTTKAGLWKSVDRGSTWTQIIGEGLTEATDVLFVHIDPASGSGGAGSQKILVSTREGVLTTTDGGGTWAPLAEQPAGEMAIRASQGGDTIYITFSSNAGPNNSQSAGGGVYKVSTTDLTAVDVTPSAWTKAYGGVSVDPNDPEHVIVSTLFNWDNEDIYESTDGGANWTALGVEAVIDASDYPHVDGSHIHWITDVKFNPLAPGEFSFITGQGFYRCTGLDSALACDFDDAGLEEMVPLQLVSPPEGAHLFSAMGDRDGFRHDDLTVSPPRFAPIRGTTRSVALAWDAPDILAKTFDASPFGALSTDGGTTWTDFAQFPTGSVSCVEYFCGLRSIAVSTDGTVIVWSPVNATPSRSVDGGATWSPSTGMTPTDPKLPPKPVADRVNPDKFYAFDVMSGVVYRSENKGADFTASTSVLPHASEDWYASNFELAAVHDHEGHLFAALADGNQYGTTGGKGLYRSTDSGDTFTQVVGVESALRVGFGAAASGASYPAIYIWGAVSGVMGIFRSTDEGATWTRLNDDKHQFGLIHQVTGDPKVFGRVYVAAEGRGILYATHE